MVHGDDFTALGVDASLDLHEQGLRKIFELKLRGRVGEGVDDLHEIRVLNRILRCDSEGLRYEADPRHAELLARALGLEEASKMSTPGVKNPDDVDFGPSELENVYDASEENYVAAFQAMHPEPRVPTKRLKKSSLDAFGFRDMDKMFPHIDVLAQRAHNKSLVKDG